MLATKLNVNIRTLLTSCEQLAKDEANYWRLKKFIKSLDTMINELRDFENQTKIPDYEKRLQELKTLTNYVESSSLTKLKSSAHSSGGVGRGEAFDDGDNTIQELRQLQKSKQNADLRKELLNEDTLRQRKPDNANSPAENMNEAVKYYNDAQEKITEHMISLTRNLREQTETANRIIKKDTETISHSTGMTDRNINSLHKETDKLNDHVRNAWKCWMWMMIVFVIVIFIGMVLFMKVMKKKT